MTYTHICTTESLRAGLEEFPPMECDVCGFNTVYVDWVGERCDTCMADLSWLAEAGRTDRFLTAIRRHAELSREDVAGRLGVKPSTVKYYEWHTPSQRYYEAFKAMIRDFYQNLGEDGIKAMQQQKHERGLAALAKLKADFFNQ